MPASSLIKRHAEFAARRTHISGAGGVNTLARCHINGTYIRKSAKTGYNLPQLLDCVVRGLRTAT